MLHAAAVVDPALRFRRLYTPHFVIYFHQGEQTLAARLAPVAERTWLELRDRYGWVPPSRTHVIIADQTDSANGWATPLPYNTIMLTAAWPSGAEFIGNTDDWLRLVFTHEFTHIAHLDQSRGWARAARSLFGRVPVAFPNLFLPRWQIEGLATYFESAVTGAGRRLAGDFRAIEREAIRRGGVALDRANGGLVAWPGATAVYAYGLGFHEYLANRFGEDRLVALANRTAGRVPFTGSRAFASVFGEPLGALWEQYNSATRAEAEAHAARTADSRRADAGPTRVTFEAYDVTGGRYLPPSCPSCPLEIAYSVRNADEFPALKVVEASGGPPRTLATRYLGGVVGADSRRVVFDQQQLHRNVAVFSDLYAVDRRDGRVASLTEGLRLQDPDVSADSRRLVATRQHRGARDLIVAPLADDGGVGPITALISEPDTQFATPRWSPDGTRIAVERHRRGEGAQVVVVDVETAAVRVVATGATRAVSPAWRPDGRAIVVAADEADRPLNLFEVTLADDGTPGPRRRLTDTVGGARSPDVSPDGRTLLYVGYTADGFDLFRIPYPPPEDTLRSAAPDAAAAPMSPTPTVPDAASADALPPSGPATGSDSRDLPYSPLPTLAPRSWTPLVGSDGQQVLFGAATGGADVLGYHRYAAAIQWRALTPATALVSDRGRPDWGATYVYDRWVPQIYARAGQTVSFLTGASALGGRAATWRERTLEAGVQVPFRQVLRSHRLVATALRSDNTIVDASGVRDFARAALRSGWDYRSSRVYGYSISPEHGIALGATAEFSGRGFGDLDDAVTVTGDARAYLPGLRRHHVTAVRIAGGTSSGSRDFGRLFRLGGPVPNPEPLDFGRGAISLFRGFRVDAVAGRHVALMNGEYRLPLRRVERGAGTFPLFLRQLHGSVLIDAGHAWNSGFRLTDVKWAVGAELSADLVAGYSLPFTLTAGVARGHDGAGRLTDTTMGYVRIGRAF